MCIRDRSLSERASERRARKVSYILLGVALLSGVLFLLAGAGWNKAAAAIAAVLCMGAPLSSTLIAGVASLRLQRAAAAVGAVVPGWQAIEQLGGIDTLQIDADDLFTADSAQLEDCLLYTSPRRNRFSAVRSPDFCHKQGSRSSAAALPGCGADGAAGSFLP